MFGILKKILGINTAEVKSHIENSYSTPFDQSNSIEKSTIDVTVVNANPTPNKTQFQEAVQKYMSKFNICNLNSRRSDTEQRLLDLQSAGFTVTDFMNHYNESDFQIRSQLMRLGIEPKDFNKNITVIDDGDLDRAEVEKRIKELDKLLKNELVSKDEYSKLKYILAGVV